MIRRRLIWKVVPGFLAVIVLATVSVAWYAGRVVRQSYIDQVALALEEKANLLAPVMLDLLLEGKTDDIDPLCDHYGEPAGMRITFILPDGKVLGDSDSDPALMDNHKFRPEIVEALNGNVGRSTRFSKTVQHDHHYVARPLRKNGQIHGVLRTSVALGDMARTLNVLYLRIAMGGVVVTIAAAIVGFVVFQRKISRPLKQLEQGARRFAEGDLTNPLPVADAEEIATFAKALNQMARQLDERIAEATQQSQEQQAVLASMIEGVIAVDPDERVITINAAAAGWMDVDLVTAHGRKSYEVIRNMRLQDLIARALDSGQPVVDELNIRGPENRLFLQAQASPIRDDRGQNAGVVIVLHDVTRLRQLEMVRQEFVANVSHELKTPIAAIKGAVETVLDDLDIDPADSSAGGNGSNGAAQDDAAPANGQFESVRRFLPIIARQGDRLNSIVEDLLTLARIESDEQGQQLALEFCDLRSILREAAETCEPRAVEKDIDVVIESTDAARAAVNPPLLVQAVINLLDNAIKYSPAGSRVQLSTRLTNSEVVIEVTDNGPGIEKKHLSRIFERFYRTDRARSRALGGTGLGLAIVKHVAQAHRGHVSVDSLYGSTDKHGSTFRIHLPAQSPSN